MDRSHARLLQYAGHRLRQAHPDYADVKLVGITEDDRGIVEFSNGDKITIPCPPLGASAIGIGARGRIQFSRGNKQLPSWRTCCRGNGRVPAEEPAIPGDWPTFRNGYDRRNRWEQEDPWLPPSLRVPVVEPEALLTYPVILRVYQGEVYEFAGDDLDWRGRVPPWYMTPLQRGQYRSTLTAPVSPSDSTIYVVSTAGLGWDHPLVIGDEEFELWDYGDDWIAVGRSTGATSHAEGSVVTQELEEPEELPRWWDFVVVDGGALIQIYPYFWWEIPDGPTYDGENMPENGDIPKLQRRDNAGDVLWDWPFPAIEVTYPDDGSPGGSGGGAS